MFTYSVISKPSIEWVVVTITFSLRLEKQRKQQSLFWTYRTSLTLFPQNEQEWRRLGSNVSGVNGMFLRERLQVGHFDNPSSTSFLQ